MEDIEVKDIEIGEKYLPIGTVVLLKGGSKRVMIAGFCTIAQDQQDKLFDYSGCIYPEGFIESNQVCLFDHSQIEKVYHLGLIDNEEREFKQKLATAISTIGEENLVKLGNETTEINETSEVTDQTGDSPVESLNENTVVTQVETPVTQVETPATQVESPVAQVESPVAQVESPVAQVESPVAQEIPQMPVAQEIPQMPAASEIPSMPTTNNNVTE